MFTDESHEALLKAQQEEFAYDSIAPIIAMDTVLKQFKPCMNTEMFELYLETSDTVSLLPAQKWLVQVRHSLGYDPRKKIYKKVGGGVDAMEVPDGVLDLAGTSLRAADMAAIAASKIITNLNMIYIHDNTFMTNSGGDLCGPKRKNAENVLTLLDALEKIVRLHPNLHTVILPPALDVLMSDYACVKQPPQFPFPRLMRVLGYTMDLRTLDHESEPVKDHAVLPLTVTTWICNVLKTSVCPRWLFSDEPKYYQLVGSDSARESRTLLTARMLDKIREGDGGPASCLLHHFIRGLVSIHAVQKMYPAQRHSWFAEMFPMVPFPPHPTATLMLQQAISYGVSIDMSRKIVHAWFEYTMGQLARRHLDVLNAIDNPTSPTARKSTQHEYLPGLSRIDTSVGATSDPNCPRKHAKEVELSLLRNEYKVDRPFFAPDCFKKEMASTTSKASKKAKGKDKYVDKSDRRKQQRDDFAREMHLFWNATRPLAVAWFRQNAPQDGTTNKRLWNGTEMVRFDKQPFSVTQLDPILPAWWKRVVREFAILRQFYIYKHCWKSETPSISEIPVGTGSVASQIAALQEKLSDPVFFARFNDECVEQDMATLSLDCAEDRAAHRAALAKWEAADLAFRRDNPGVTLLFRAMRLQMRDTVSELLCHGVDINATNSEQETMLTCFVKENRPVQVQLTLDFKADVNRANGEGKTPLMIAVSRELLINHKIVDLLLQHGARAAVKDAEGRTAATYAQKNGFMKTFGKLLALEESEAEEGGEAGGAPAASSSESPVLALCEKGGSAGTVSSNTALGTAFQTETTPNDSAAESDAGTTSPSRRSTDSPTHTPSRQSRWIQPAATLATSVITGVRCLTPSPPPVPPPPQRVSPYTELGASPMFSTDHGYSPTSYTPASPEGSPTSYTPTPYTPTTPESSPVQSGEKKELTEAEAEALAFLKASRTPESKMEYLIKHNIDNMMTTAANEVLKAHPEDPLAWLVQWFANGTKFPTELYGTNVTGPKNTDAAIQYLGKHSIEKLLDTAVNTLIVVQPHDPRVWLYDWFHLLNNTVVARNVPVGNRATVAAATAAASALGSGDEAAPAPALTAASSSAEPVFKNPVPYEEASKEVQALRDVAAKLELEAWQKADAVAYELVLEEEKQKVADGLAKAAAATAVEEKQKEGGGPTAAAAGRRQRRRGRK